MDKTYLVYIHKNKINNKVYVGMTSTTLEQRWAGGIRGYSHNPYFVEDILKYGVDNFDHIVVKNNLTRQKAQQLERDTIIELHATDPNFGYNCNCKGYSSKITYKKVSEALTGKPLSPEHIENIKNRVVSEETKEKIRSKKIGKKSFIRNKIKTKYSA